ncbi:MAG TPA: hypothetical protein VI731_06175 [Bacteroidia bacterium]|nr:hypothetical protein [Bacteroidia bacterium]
MSGYFSFEDLLLLKGLEGKKLGSVVYHNWQNRFGDDELFEFLDKLELHFSDGSRLVLSATEDEDPRIVILKDFDAEKDRLMLLHEFGGKIDLQTEDRTSNPLWQPVSGKTVQLVSLVDDGEQSFRNDAVLFDFGDDKLEIHPGQEGLIVEPWEDV